MTHRSMPAGRVLWGGFAFVLFFIAAADLCAEPLPQAGEILAFAREQLPSRPIRMTGSLKHRAPNGFVLKDLAVEMRLNWGADPAAAEYRLRNVKTGQVQELGIRWTKDGPEYRFSESADSVKAESFDPGQQIENIGVTWSDLSFSFLWDEAAETVGSGKRLGRDCFILSVPRPGKRRLVLWIEQETGRMLGAREEDPSGRVLKDIRVASVQQFDGLWMIKDLDIIHSQTNQRTVLRINTVE